MRFASLTSTLRVLLSWCGSLRSPAPYVSCSVASLVTPLAHRPITRQSFGSRKGEHALDFPHLTGVNYFFSLATIRIPGSWEGDGGRVSLPPHDRSLP